MNPQVPGYQTGAPPASGAGAPAGATVVGATCLRAASTPPAPAPQPAPPKPRRPGWIAVWTMFTVAILLAATAVALSVTKLTTNTATTTTVTAAPPPPTFSPDQVAAAKKEVVRRQHQRGQVDTDAQRNFFAASRDRQSPEYRPALGQLPIRRPIETVYSKGI